MQRRCTGIIFLLAASPTLYGSVIVGTSLELTGLQVVTNTGTGSVLTGSSVFANTSAADNLGDSAFDVTDNPSNSVTPLSYANAAADGNANTANADSGLDIPSLDAAVLPTSTDGNAEICGFFEVTDATGQNNPAIVTINAALMASQNLFTGPSGLSADSEITFQFWIYENDALGNFLGNSPLIYYDNLLSIGPNTSKSFSSPGPQSTNALSLLTNTQYSFFAEVDAESDGADSPTPEPASLTLAAAGLGAFLLLRKRRVLPGVTK